MSNLYVVVDEGPDEVPRDQVVTFFTDFEQADIAAHGTVYQLVKPGSVAAFVGDPTPEHQTGGGMSKFQVGDHVQMPGVPLVVEVLEFGTCDHPGCENGDGETFRFKDPGTGADDWEHVASFEKVPA